jgi:hypothetical protein
VTNARICSEIPFQDGAEGACVWTVSRKTELIDSKKWSEMRPKMLMIDAHSWTEIKKDWLKACRAVGKNCNVEVQSVDTVVASLLNMSEWVKAIKPREPKK